MSQDRKSQEGPQGNTSPSFSLQTSCSQIPLGNRGPQCEERKVKDPQLSWGSGRKPYSDLGVGGSLDRELESTGPGSNLLVGKLDVVCRSETA